MVSPDARSNRANHSHHEWQFDRPADGSAHRKVDSSGRGARTRNLDGQHTFTWRYRDFRFDDGVVVEGVVVNYQTGVLNKHR